MWDVIMQKNNEKVEKENFSGYVRELARQAKKLQTDLTKVQHLDIYENSETAISKKNICRARKGVRSILHTDQPHSAIMPKI